MSHTEDMERRGCRGGEGVKGGKGGRDVKGKEIAEGVGGVTG